VIARAHEDKAPGIQADRMRIAYFTESLPPLVDGVSHSLGYLHKSLISHEIECRFYSPFLPADKSWEGSVCQVISIPFPLYTRYRVSLPAFHDLKYSLDKFRPDLVHTCSPFFLGLFGIRYAREKKIPVANSFHTRFVSYLKYYGYGWLEKYGWGYLRWYYNSGDITLVPSDATIAELRSKGFENLKLWSRGIDLKHFSPAFADRNLKERWSPSGKPVAIYVGRLVKEKDIDIILKAHEILREKEVEYQLVFVGDGPMRRQIEKEAPDALLAGRLEEDELSRAYASSDIFLFPSTTESFGNVVLEAAASGLPTVGSAEGGVGELIQEGETGYRTSPGDYRDFAEKLEILVKNDAIRLYMSATAVEFASKKSWDSINSRLFQDYEKLIAAGAESGRGARILKQVNTEF